MNKKEMFVKMVEELLDGRDVSMYTDALAYFEAFKSSEDKSSKKVKFTDNGKLILQYMRENLDATQNMFKAREVAEGIFISSRSVSGSMRKLVSDGYVEKLGQDPIIYSLTETGKTVSLDEE